MKSDRQILIELIGDVQYMGGLEEKLADYLIANGVTVKEKKSSKKAQSSSCCRCGKEYSDDTYKYCPTCGACLI